jgi:FdhE protein
MSTKILEPGEIGQVAPFPNIVLPLDASLFDARARRLHQLAQKHAMGPFLSVIAHLAQAQHAALQLRSAVVLPAATLEQSRLHGMPPLSWQAVRSEDLHTAGQAGWQLDLDAIISHLITNDVTAFAQSAATLAALDSNGREALADAVLDGGIWGDDPIRHALFAPLVGAALQVWWTRQSAALDEADIGHIGSSTVCPVCAARPVASVVEIGAEQSNLRYLHCSLCSTQWHMVRVTCSSCESTKGIAYYNLTGTEETAAPSRKIAFARAEACDACHSYLKIFTREKNPMMEATADDLATLALDMLVDDAGYLRSGPNLLFSPGVAPLEDGAATSVTSTLES